jgi:hypothetical protein
MIVRPCWPFALVCLLGAGATSAADVVRGCLPAASVPIMVRIGAEPAVAALLEGGIETPLSVAEAASRRLLWSAAAHPAVVRTFADMDTAFAGSLAALDLDGDGLHDRIYAGDLAGRLWRFDLQHGAPAAQWARGGVFADFRNDEGRGFLAAPDVSLSAPPGAPAWLNIAVGTAAPGNAAANNRFYALRDHAVHESWTEEQYQDWQPLHEADLLRVTVTAQADTEAATSPDPAFAGWYVELGAGHVVTPTITINHRAVLAIAAVLPRGNGPCEVLTRIASFDLVRQQLVPATTGDHWQASLPLPVPVAAGFSLEAIDDAVTACVLGGQRIAACDVDTRPRKTWWRRNDAE